MKITVTQLKELIKEALEDAEEMHMSLDRDPVLQAAIQAEIEAQEARKKAEAARKNAERFIPIADIKAALANAESGTAYGKKPASTGKAPSAFSGRMEESLKKLIYREIKKSLVQK